MITIGNRTPHFSAGQHGSTFGGNPVSAAAGMATIKVIEMKNLIKNAIAMEKLIRRELSVVDGIDHIRGKGLLLGIVLKENVAQEVVQAAAQKGLLLNAPSDSVIRIAPALNISKAHVVEFAKKFKTSLSLAALNE
jgi:acetylornithine aminotransferase